ncbi:MAG: helix-turn-helix transcriptional regulator [Prevotellaceae bacterium]|jgi:DNA-binding CsgD family transcriptional regulator|nr:helix-turn-helix transcriptional regulator [Prevotellaceae bacterium]
MLKNQHIAIVTDNGVVALGLEALLYEYATLTGVLHFTTAIELRKSTQHFGLAFIDSNIYVASANQISTKNKILLLHQAPDESGNSLLPSLYMHCPQELLVKQLEALLPIFDKATQDNGKSDLSDREREVLVLVAKGMINKEIADQLSISLHTVITHRKNITSKLGIKTISGLTIYAILNGLITVDEVE